MIDGISVWWFVAAALLTGLLLWVVWPLEDIDNQ